MYLFSRSRHIDPGEVSGAIEWTLKTTETVKSITGRDVEAWTAVLSPELGTVVWSMWGETMSEILAAGDQLAADASFMKAVEKGDDYFDGPIIDGLALVVHGTPDLAGDPPEYVGVATAVAAPGRLGDAMAAGVEIADHVTKVTGDNTLFLVNSTGLFGGVAWLTPNANAAALDAGESALTADPDWIGLIDRIGTAFAPGAAQAVYRRIG